MQLSGEIPTTYNFNVGFQKKLPGGIIWDIAYVGSVQNHLPRRVNANAVPYGAAFQPQNQDTTLAPSSNPGQNALAQDFLRPYVGYGNINLRLFDANANYHGVQTQIDRRFANGLFLNANYTFSKALDTQDVNTDFARIDGFDKQANYGPAGFDRRHIFNFNWVYQLPKNEGANCVRVGPHQQLADLGRLPPRERPALRPDLERQRRRQPQHHGFRHRGFAHRHQRRPGLGPQRTTRTSRSRWASTRRRRWAASAWSRAATT